MFHLPHVRRPAPHEPATETQRWDPAVAVHPTGRRRVPDWQHVRPLGPLSRPGQTNREVANGLYVSMKSIEFHLGNASAKLGLRNRRELISVLKPT